MNPYAQILNLTTRKRKTALNTVEVLHGRVLALFEWQNCSKVEFVFALDAFAFALCIIKAIPFPALLPAALTYVLLPLIDVWDNLIIKSMLTWRLH